ncbi:hypothetical protein [Streptomyces cahuitamycinicus]|uniref:hypothetical protein n=1 Tax=Streptomyces cahuitamycinicus TaxID=2070367 RepID=UPI001FEC91B7|nr:hypothetical protein [Streptomyces cahuitamycinicus]
MGDGAPQRADPSPPGRAAAPPGNAVLGVPLSLYDRLRDGLGVSGPWGRRVLAGLIGLLVSAAVAVLVRKRS